MVSIIIPVYNGADYLAGAIDSALAQSYENREVIVVNDGSTDNGATAAVAQGYGQRIRYYKKENGGVATAFNHGIAQMHGEYFSWLSHDDLYKPDKVRAQMALFDSLPQDTILYTGYELFYDDDKTATVPIRFEDRYDITDLDIPLFPVFRGIANGCTILFHKRHFARVGLFNPSLPTTQDYDLWFRMFRGASVHYCPQTNVLMRQHKGQGTKTIPNHLEDANRLWIWMMGQVTDAEKASVSGTPELFYRDLSAYLAQTSYKEAAEYANRQAQTEQMRWQYLPQDEAQRFTYHLVKQVQRLRAKLDATENPGHAKNGPVNDIQIMNSLSWKITAPLRAVHRLFTRGGR